MLLIFMLKISKNKPLIKTFINKNHFKKVINNENKVNKAKKL